jgi:Glutamine synthetase, beta-Grasp domain
VTRLRNGVAAASPSNFLAVFEKELAMSDTREVMQMIKEHDVKYVDFRFTDPRGKWQHLAHHVRTITEDFLNEGVMFDGPRGSTEPERTWLSVFHLGAHRRQYADLQVRRAECREPIR